MKAEIAITKADRLSAVGPAALHWQVILSVTLEGQPTYRGAVAARQESPSNFRVEPIVGNDLPDWLPPGILRERVHWYVLNQLSSAVQKPDGTLSETLAVEFSIVEQFEVYEDSWSYKGMRILS
ncbi:MAG: hypothetical protein ABL977_02725 [Candidatus Eisenbacteria bacterium]